MTTNTTIGQKAARRKLNLIEPASDMENVSKTCIIIGYSRQQLHLLCTVVGSGGVRGVWLRHNLLSETILTENGREYCGRPDHHPFELFLQFEEIEHRTTAVRLPQSNGIVERLQRTLLDEHFRIKDRIKFYEGLEEMQIDLDEYLKKYNQERAHQD